MADEQTIPAPRDDDPDEVGDKLSIAAAMWARGDRADALSWLRRAAESASDADRDMRALELAKAASDLAPLVASATMPTAARAPSAAPPAAPRPSPSAPPRASAAPPRASAAPPARPVPPSRSSLAATKPMTAPPPRPPTGTPPAAPPRATAKPSNVPSKLAPLPPMRPLTASPSPLRRSSTSLPAATPTRSDSRPADGSRPPSSRIPAAASPTPRRSGADAPSAIESASMRASAPFDFDHEKTSTMPRAEAATLIASTGTATRPSDVEPLRQHLELERRAAGQREGDDGRTLSDTDYDQEATRVAPSAVLRSSMRDIEPAYGEATADHERVDPPRLPAPSAPPVVEPMLPLAVGVRVRVYTSEQGVWVVPEHEGGDRAGGVPALLVPVREEDDLRNLFGKR